MAGLQLSLRLGREKEKERGRNLWESRMPRMKEASKKNGTISDDHLMSSFLVVCQLLPWVSPLAPAPMSALVLG